MEGQLVTMTEIAELADVRRPTVTNWRRRHVGFPRPIRDDGDQPLFDAEEVTKWLDDRPVPRVPGTDDLPTTYGARFREGLRLRTMATLRGLLPGDRLLAAGLALAALRRVYERPIPDLASARHWAKQVEGDRPELTGMFTHDLDELLPEAAPLVAAVEEMCAASGEDEAAERLVGAAGRLGSGLRATMTPPPVADVVAEIAGDTTGKSIYDPAAGSGSLILRVLRSGPPKRVVAADSDPAAVRMLRQRFICHDVPVEAAQRNSLRSRDWVGVDVVVLEPPFVSSDEPGEAVRWLRSWVRYAAGQLVPGGRAIVLVPSWMLTRVGERDPVAQARDALLKQGVIAAVIQLPRRVHSFRTGTELVVLVLERPPAEGRHRIVLGNADYAGVELGKLAGCVRGALAGNSPDVPYDVLGMIPIAELGWHRPLLPAQLLVPPAASRVDVIEAATRRLAELPDFGPFDPPPVTDTASRREYVKLPDVARVRAGHRLPPDIVGVSGRPVIGVSELRGETSIGVRCIPEEVAAPYVDDLTAPGDVVVLPTDPPRARVDEAGGAVVESPAQVVRITGYGRRAGTSSPDDTGTWCTPHVLAAMLTAPRNAARATGSLVRRVRVEGLELPVLTGADVDRLDAVLKDLGRRRDRAAGELAALDELTAAIAGGVADGALSVAGDSSELEDVERVAHGTS